MIRFRFIVCLAVLVLASIPFIFSVKYFKERGKREVAEQNVIAAMSDLKTYKSKNDALITEVQGLRLNASDLKKVNSELAKEIEDMKVKLKNATSISQIETSFDYANKDSIVAEEIIAPDIPEVIDKRFSIKNESIVMSFTVRDCSVILPESLTLSINNKQSIVTDVTYKGWWLWKKAVGVNLKVKNSNKYYSVINAYYIDLRNK